MVETGVRIVLENLTITGGSAALGGGICTLSGAVYVWDTVISGNSATEAGGGIFTNVGTIADNLPVGDGDGIFTRGGTVSIENSTLSGHDATGLGGGIHSAALATKQGVVMLGNSVLASNNSAACNGALTSTGYNVIEAIPAGCSFGGAMTDNVTNVNPQFGVLKQNGGTTQTHALLEGSPAVVNDPGACASGDQRSATRPQGAGCDIGAYEGVCGDCNADILVDAGDVSALTLEIFDGDGSDPVSVPEPDFVGDSLDCNANEDLAIDAGDVLCLVLIVFEGAGSYGT